MSHAGGGSFEDDCGEIAAPVFGDIAFGDTDVTPVLLTTPLFGEIAPRVGMMGSRVGEAGVRGGNGERDLRIEFIGLDGKLLEVILFIDCDDLRGCGAFLPRPWAAFGERNGPFGGNTPGAPRLGPRGRPRAEGGGPRGRSGAPTMRRTSVIKRDRQCHSKNRTRT